ncbi:MAG: hypothetical protein WBN22_00975 [Verrucomicrobiia bacterium]
MNEFNGNGNGHQKAFELTQPKTAEQIKREALNAMMPQLRRACSQDHRLKKFVGAKWLFDTLTDNSFMNKFGGDGWGRVYCSLKDLRRMYGHDEDTIAVWRDKLIETGWIWFKNRWPKCCWGISGACDQPELPFVGQEYMAIMAKTSARGQPPVAVMEEQTEKTVNSGANGHDIRLNQPPQPVAPTVIGGQSDRTNRGEKPPLAVSEPAEARLDRPSTAVTATVNGGHSDGESPVGLTVSDGHIRETPALSPLGVRNGFKRSTDLNARNGSGGAKKISLEDIYLLDVRAMMELWKKGSSEKEMMNNGSWWRNAYRKNPKLARTVLADANSAVKEGRIKFNPPSMAIDLWTRLGGGKVTNQALKEKAAVAPAARTH